MGTTVSSLVGGAWVPWDATSNPTPPVDPPTTSMMVGVDVSLNGNDSTTSLVTEFPRVCKTLGLDPNSHLVLGNHLKVFQASSVVGAGNKFEQVGYNCRPVLAHKSTSLSDWNARMDKLTKPEVWVYWQERGFKKGPSPQAYNATYKAMDQARKAHPKGKYVLLCMDGARAQEIQTRQWDQLDPASANVDYIGMDCYDAGGPPYRQPDDEFYELIQMWQHFKGTYSALKGFCIPEFGLGRTTGTGAVPDPTIRAAALEADFQYLSDQGCTWVNYWEENNSNLEGITHDYATAPDPPVRNVLLSWITREDLP